MPKIKLSKKVINFLDTSFKKVGLHHKKALPRGSALFTWKNGNEELHLVTLFIILQSLYREKGLFNIKKFVTGPKEINKLCNVTIKEYSKLIKKGDF